MDSLVAFLTGSGLTAGIVWLLRGMGAWFNGRGRKEVKESELIGYALKRIDELQNDLNNEHAERKALEEKYDKDLKSYQNKVIRLKEDKLILTTMLLKREPDKAVLNLEYRALREEIQ